MKSFLKFSVAVVVLAIGFKVAQAEIGLSPSAENVISASSLEQALYRLMALPAGSVLARRPPAEARAELDSLVKQSANNPQLFSVRAQEDERQLDFKAAEADWQQAAQLSKDKQAALLSLADFYERRLQPQPEVQTLLEIANLPSKADDLYRPEAERASWLAIHRALQVASDYQLSAETQSSIYEAWSKRYPKQSEPLHQYFRALVARKNLPHARAVAARIHTAFPNEIALGIRTDAELARVENGEQAALAIYSKQFSPLWPDDLRASYYALLSDAHQLREFLAEARRQSAANPTALEPVLRAFFYYEEQQKRDVASQQLLELEARRSVSKTPWTASELKTVGILFMRLTEHDEAAHAYYSLYALPGVSEADKSLALASLIDLLLDFPEQPLQFGTRDLSIYRNVATLDRHPGFLNGILSLVLNTTEPDYQYQSVSQAGIAYFHRAMAERLIERMKTEFPASQLAPPLESKLFSAYSVYGQKDAILRLAPPWLAAHGNAADYTKVALLLAGTYASGRKVPQELAIYDGLLRKLGEASGHRPLGEVSEVPESEKPPAAKSPEYAQVLDLYISRLTQLKRLTDAVALYRREIDRNPDDPGIYERLALFVEQNHFDSDLEQTYRAAMKRFNGTTWPDKLARFYMRHRQSDAYVALAKDVIDRFDGSELAKFISAVPPGKAFGELIYRQVNLYAHQRFPHNLTFVRNLLASYQAKGFEDPAAFEALLRANWFYDANLRSEFFEYLSRTNKLQAELAALPKPAEASQQKNTAALMQYAEGKAWLADFEGAAPAFVALANLAPGDDSLASRTISIERSLAPSVPGAFDRAVRLAEQRGKAMPGDAGAATLVGEIYGDRDQFSKALPWWNKVATMRPGTQDGYLNAATVFWDYFQFPDALRLLESGRAAAAKPALYAYEAGAIHENQNDYRGAIDEYLKAVLAAPQPVTKVPTELEERKGPPMEAADDVAQSRLIVLAKRKATAAEIEQRTAALAQSKPFKAPAFHLRLALLEDQERRTDIHALLNDSLASISDVDQVSLVQTECDRLGFDDLSVAALQRTVQLDTDPVEKLSARLDLAKFYQEHQDFGRAESEYSALLTENPNLLGIVRANTDFYWTEKQPKKAVTTLEAAASRAQAPYQAQFRREAAQKAADSADYQTARRLLDLLLTSDPFNGDLLAAKAATYASEGDNKALIDFYSAQLGQLKSAKLSEDEKTQRTATLRRGYINALIKAKQFIEALEQYQLLLNGFPEDENLPREMARFAETNHLADRLTQYYEKATADSPRNYRWPMVLARIDISLRRYPEAVAALDKAVYVRPDRTDLFIAKADLETRLLRFDNALKTYQKLYDASYHDSQYLASQASLHARLGHNAETVRLLRAAYVDAHPKELNGYVEAISSLVAWNMYAEADQVYKDAKPLVQPANGEAQRLATLEGQTLVGLRRPTEALETVVSVRRVSSDPKHPWNMKPQIDAIGAEIDNLYTPEEKAAFSAKLESPQGVPNGVNIYDVACASGFTDLAARRLYKSAVAKPRALWRTLENLQTARLQDAELAKQLETIVPLLPKTENANSSLLAAYARAGDSANELRLSREQLTAGSGISDMHRYVQLLIGTHADLATRVKELDKVNPKAADQLTQELLVMLPEDQALAALQGRGANLPGLWTPSYSALTELYFFSPKAASQFDAILGPRTVGAQLGNSKGDNLRGDVWYYYAARYGDYLTGRQDAAAADFLAAPLEAAPIASDSYVALGKDEAEFSHFDAAIRAYEQAVELSPDRADVHVFMAEAESGRKHSQAAIDQLRIAFSMLAKTDKPEDYDTAKTVLTRMNQYNAIEQLKPAADELIAAKIKKGGSFEFLQLVEGILTDSPNRKAALAWVLQLLRAPELDGIAEQLENSKLLSNPEKRPFYEADIQNRRTALTKAHGEAADEARGNLQIALSSYVKYLNEQGDSQAAWQVLHQIEPKTERPANLLLEVAAASGHLAETLAQYEAGTLEAPTGEEILVVASEFKKNHPDWSLQIREWEYWRELVGDDPPATAYFGMADVRLEQKRTDEALALIRDVTLSVGDPFQNLGPAIELLEKAGLKKNAAEYAKEWRTAEPWNTEASWAVARTTQDQGLLDAVRKSERADYSLRAQAANALRDLKAPASGTTELDLLTHAEISSQEASQPFFVMARLRAKLYAEAIALKPSLREARLALAESALENKQEALGFAAWNSYSTLPSNLEWLHSAPLDRALDHQPDRTEKVEELVADTLVTQQQFAGAETLYSKILEQTDDKATQARVRQLQKNLEARIQVDVTNRDRAPTISAELTQPRIVKVRMKGVAE